MMHEITYVDCNKLHDMPWDNLDYEKNLVTFLFMTSAREFMWFIYS